MENLYQRSLKVDYSTADRFLAVKTISGNYDIVSSRTKAVTICHFEMSVAIEKSPNAIETPANHLTP